MKRIRAACGALLLVAVLGCGGQHAGSRFENVAGELADARSERAAPMRAPAMEPSHAPRRLAEESRAKNSSGMAAEAPRAAEAKAKGTHAPAKPSVAPKPESMDFGREEFPESSPPANKSADLAPRQEKSEETPRAEDLQSGILTAGSFDDHAYFEAYQDYLFEFSRTREANLAPAFDFGECVEIFVQNAAGQPIGDARVVVRADQMQAAPGNREQIYLETRTGSDGRAYFFSGLDANGASDFVLEVIPEDGSPAKSISASTDEGTWVVRLPEASSELPKRLDLAMVVDTTGSMDDELEYLKAEIRGIASEVNQLFPDVQQRYALIVYRDKREAYVTRTFDFTDSLAEFQEHLSLQSALGGGDKPEALELALNETANLRWREEPGTARVVFLVTDAPPHRRDAQLCLDLFDQLRGQNITVFPIAASGVDDAAQYLLRAGAFLTSGKYVFLTDHSGVGNPHATPEVPYFEVERLDRLMVRLIATELAGREQHARHIIDQGGSSPNIQPGSPTPSKSQVRSTTVPQTPLSPTEEPPIKSESVSEAWGTTPMWLWSILPLLVIGAFIVVWERGR